jgi:ABC-type transporter MlaC component
MLPQPLKNLRSPHPPRREPAWHARLAAVLVLLLAISDAGPVCAGQAMEGLKLRVEEGLRILNDPRYAAAACKPEQRRLLRELLDRTFDFTEFSRRVLAEKWASFRPRERAEFVTVFSEFLATYYLAHLQEIYTDEKVIFIAETATGAPGRTVVTVQVIWRGRGIPVAVRMRSNGSGWKAYDVNVFGISAVQVYRAQLHEVLAGRSPAELIELIRQRITE